MGSKPSDRTNRGAQRKRYLPTDRKTDINTGTSSAYGGTIWVNPPALCRQKRPEFSHQRLNRVPESSVQPQGYGGNLRQERIANVGTALVLATSRNGPCNPVKDPSPILRLIEEEGSLRP